MYDPKQIDRARFAEAVRAGMVRRGLNQSALADALGVTHPTVSDWMNRKKTPGRQNLEKVMGLLDLEWGAVTADREGASPAPPPSEEDDVIFVPYMPRAAASAAGYENGSVHAAVGAPNGPQAPGDWPDPGPEHDLAGSHFSRRELQRLTNRPPESLRLLRVVGDSMEPLLRANDTVVYVPMRRVTDAGVYVLLLDGGAIVKRVQRYGGGALLVIPENEAYQRELFIPLEDADTPGMYRSSESGLVAHLQVEGKVVYHPGPL